MYKTIFFFGFMICISSVFAQTGSIHIIDNAGANELVQQHITFNKERSKLPGWRIQIFSSKSLLEAKDAKSSFLNSNEDMDAEIVFEAPNYKVRIGNYKDRFAANRDFQQIVTLYPNAFICKDMIHVGIE